jgi:hypothetical protein
VVAAGGAGKTIEAMLVDLIKGVTAIDMTVVHNAIRREASNVKAAAEIRDVGLGLQIYERGLGLFPELPRLRSCWPRDFARL